MRMIKLGARYVNADRLYSIEPVPGTRTVHITYEGAPGQLVNYEFKMLGPGGEDTALAEWARSLATALDPASISFNTDPGPASGESSHDHGQPTAEAAGQDGEA